MGRRTKSELIQAEQRRLKKVEELIKSPDKNLPVNAKITKIDENLDVEQQFKKVFGYSLNLIRQDLRRSAIISYLIVVILAAIYLF